MYLPEHFAETDATRLHALIRAYPLGILVTHLGEALDANHLPFELIGAPPPNGTLRAHVARSNPLWNEIVPGSQALVIFRGADGYISPNWYPSKHATHRQVPTWNYQVVHAYGTLQVHDSEQFLKRAVGRLTAMHEGREREPWRMSDSAPGYIEARLREIVGIEIVIDRLVGKFKLGQNKDARDRDGAANELAQRGNVALADAMRTPDNE